MKLTQKSLPLYFLLLSFLNFCLSACASNTEKKEANADFVPGVLLVRFQDNLGSIERQKAYKLDEKHDLFAQELQHLGSGYLYKISIPKEVDINEAIKTLMKTGLFKFVEKEFIYHEMKVEKAPSS